MNSAYPASRHWVGCDGFCYRWEHRGETIVHVCENLNSPGQWFPTAICLCDAIDAAKVLERFAEAEMERGRIEREIEEAARLGETAQEAPAMQGPVWEAINGWKRSQEIARGAMGL
jgi:hypothetical protein